jgi:hypothetical protein
MTTSQKQITKWSNGWQHEKTVRTFDCGQIVTTIISRKKGVRFTYVQECDVWSTGKTRITREAYNPSGELNEKLTMGKMTLRERCEKMEQLEMWIQRKEATCAFSGKSCKAIF